MNDRCELCGRTPAVLVHLRKSTGMLIARRWETLDVPLCREDGLGIARKWLAWNLVAGWWGVISFFANFYALGADVVGLLRLARLPDAQGRPVQGSPLSNQAVADFVQAKEVPDVDAAHREALMKRERRSCPFCGSAEIPPAHKYCSRCGQESEPWIPHAGFWW